MAEDREILREIWEGRIPVCLTLDSEEVVAEQPEPMFVMAPRHSYFPLITDKVHRHFSRCAGQEKQEMWLEYEGQALKWHHPIGVLFDLYANDASLPWNITAHFQNFPEEELLHCPSKEFVESLFITTIKEADALKHRSEIINGMQKKDHRQLWTGLQHDKFDQFWAVNRKLMETSGEDMFKFIPYRIYQPDRLYIQKLFKPLADEGYKHTLRQLLQVSFPDTWNEDMEKSQRILVQGVEPSLDIPVLWLSEHLSYPDNFLHICMVRRESGQV